KHQLKLDKLAAKLEKSIEEEKTNADTRVDKGAALVQRQRDFAQAVGDLAEVCRLPQRDVEALESVDELTRERNTARAELDDAVAKYKAAGCNSFCLTLDYSARTARCSLEPGFFPGRVWTTEHIWEDGLTWVGVQPGDGSHVVHEGKRTTVYNVLQAQLQAKRPRLRVDEEKRKAKDAWDKNSRSRSPQLGQG
ncbi:hypothetical protein HKX48_007773, partial [Thoreauomyces humboldtii]